MESRPGDGVLTLAVILVLSGGGPLAAQAPPDSLPPGVTRQLVEEGKRVFGGVGLCLACHGPEAKGGLGPDLTSGAWLHGSGTYDELVARVLKGVPMAEAKSGSMMPPRGGGDLSEAQIRAVAAYIWTVSRRKPPA